MCTCIMGNELELRQVRKKELDERRLTTNHVIKKKKDATHRRPGNCTGGGEWKNIRGSERES